MPSYVRREVGWPDEMQARLLIIDEAHRLGSKKAFCVAVGLPYRYYYLIMEWLRSPAHPKILHYFGWSAVYATVEDLAHPREYKRPGRPLGSITAKPKSLDEQRAYWRQKQTESRKRKGSMVHYTKRVTNHPAEEGKVSDGRNQL